MTEDVASYFHKGRQKMTIVTTSQPTRREALTMAAIAGLAACLAPKLSFADEKTVAAEIRKLYGDRTLDTGRIKLDVPEVAENGLVVPIGIEIDSPMTEADHVTSVHVFADRNPLPGVVSYTFTPACGKASAATRMRLAETQNIVCVAELSTGALHMAKAKVTVTVGGCTG